MSEARYYCGFVIEVDAFPRRVRIDGLDVTREIGAVLDAPSKTAGSPDAVLFRLAEQLIERSPVLGKRKEKRREPLEALKLGTTAWHQWRTDNPDIRPILYKADLRPDTLGVALSGVDFAHANLTEADLRGANLVGANFHEANLGGADLSGADLTGANFCRTDLYKTTLRKAILHGANLQGTQLAKTDFRGAQLVGCTIYGLSAWDLKLDEAVQRDLIIVYERDDPPEASTLVVDDLRVAQFIYLLLHNPNIRDVLDTITSKVVLILGRFTEERKPVLDAIREQLRTPEHGYVPVIFDFDRPRNKDMTGTVETLARLARFIIADISDPSSVPHELATIVPFMRTTTVLPIKLAGSKGYSMFDDMAAYPWVLPVSEYSDAAALLSTLREQLARADERAANLRR
jgi:hypothetical protein